MVDTARQRSLYELTDAISLHDKARALLLLQGFLNASDGGEEAAIGHIYMISRTLRQMLVVLEKNVRDSRAIWQALWPALPGGSVCRGCIRSGRRAGIRTART